LLQFKKLIKMLFAAFFDTFFKSFCVCTLLRQSVLRRSSWHPFHVSHRGALVPSHFHCHLNTRVVPRAEWHQRWKYMARVWIMLAYFNGSCSTFIEIRFMYTVDKRRKIASPRRNICNLFFRKIKLPRVGSLGGSHSAGCCCRAHKLFNWCVCTAQNKSITLHLEFYCSTRAQIDLVCLRAPESDNLLYDIRHGKNERMHIRTCYSTRMCIIMSHELLVENIGLRESESCEAILLDYIYIRQQIGWFYKNGKICTFNLN
jgi:hypothetical protein